MSIIQNAARGVQASLPYVVTLSVLAILVYLYEPQAFKADQRPSVTRLVSFYCVAGISVGAVWGILRPWATTLLRQTVASVPAAFPFAVALIVGLVHGGELSALTQFDYIMMLILPFFAGPLGVASFHAWARTGLR